MTEKVSIFKDEDDEKGVEDKVIDNQSLEALIPNLIYHTRWKRTASKESVKLELKFRFPKRFRGYDLFHEVLMKYKIPIDDMRESVWTEGGYILKGDSGDLGKYRLVIDSLDVKLKVETNYACLERAKDLFRAINEYVSLYEKGMAER
ncbi:hypothetical protein JW756_03715 [Candidatus Woesearchaeota archaeon]|nr:hypothetical protein [Candidatus Woesearchaeota archaeon]